jgi:hypothetical protein
MFTGGEVTGVNFEKGSSGWWQFQNTTTLVKV